MKWGQAQQVALDMMEGRFASFLTKAAEIDPSFTVAMPRHDEMIVTCKPDKMEAMLRLMTEVT